MRSLRQNQVVIRAEVFWRLLSLTLVTGALPGLAQSATESPGTPGRSVSHASSAPVSTLEAHRAAILRSSYGTIPVAELLRTLGENSGGPDTQWIFQALALRKPEAVPLLRTRLKQGGMWEKHMLTKFLRVCPWPEATPELLALVRDDGEHWLPRQGALHALGVLGELAAGPEAVRILESSRSPDTLRLAAIAVVARLGYREGVPAIAPLVQNEQIHCRVFATRALAELGESVDRSTLLSAAQHSDYMVRQEASAALWALAGDEVTTMLEHIAKSDFNEAVRAAAAQSLLRREMRGHSAREKAGILQQALEKSDRLTRQWVVHTLIEEGQEAGRAFVETLATRPDPLGERARASLILATPGGKTARTP